MGSMWVRRAGWGLTGIFVLFMALDIAIKIIDLPVVDQTMLQLGWPAGYGRLIGGIELVCVALYLVRPTSVLGAVLMTGLLGGAIATHVRVHDPLFSHILFGVYLGLFMWGGLWCRSARLRAVFPIGAGEGPAATD